MSDDPVSAGHDTEVLPVLAHDYQVTYAQEGKPTLDVRVFPGKPLEDITDKFCRSLNRTERQHKKLTSPWCAELSDCMAVVSYATEEGRKPVFVITAVDNPASNYAIEAAYPFPGKDLAAMLLAYKTVLENMTDLISRP